MLRNQPFVTVWVAILLALPLTPSASAGSSLCATVFGEKSAPVLRDGPKIIILSAPSGGGKTTLANLLVRDFPHLKLSISTTTRAPRGTERDGVDYHFLSKEEFQERVRAGFFAEHSEVHGNWYGTDASNIEKEFERGNSVLSLVDVQGAEKLKARFPGQVYTIFISPPSLEVLESRLRGRGTDTEEVIRKRLANAQAEMAKAADFDAVVVNDDLEAARSELAALVIRHQLVAP